MVEYKCFTCEKKIIDKINLVTTKDGETVFVDPICYKKIVESGELGYQPPWGGSRLYVLKYSLNLESIRVVALST
jgi:DNA-directed RNA polymerase subunit RPC12/RpoP